MYDYNHFVLGTGNIQFEMGEKILWKYKCRRNYFSFSYADKRDITYDYIELHKEHGDSNIIYWHMLRVWLFRLFKNCETRQDGILFSFAQNNTEDHY